MTEGAESLAAWWALRLASGTARFSDPLPASWDAVFEGALRERLATLAWLRGGPLIRRLANADEAARWRGHALRSHELAQLQATELADLVRVLDAAGVTPIVLKGLPLGAMLYGDIAARPVSDTDLFVPIAQRGHAHAALLGAGWRHLGGASPAESTYQRASAITPNLELHSSVLDDALLAHVRAPEPTGSIVDVGGVSVFAHVGVLRPVFLAAHLAKHNSVRLLWWLDFATLWSTMPAEAREAAHGLANNTRLERHLQWALEGARLVETIRHGAVDDGLDAVERLRARHAHHNALRLGALASGVGDRIRVATAVVWPRELRAHPAAHLRYLARRARALLVRVGGGRFRKQRVRVETPGGRGSRVIAVSREALLETVQAATAAGAAAWIRARGTSMLPAIPRGAAVRVGPRGVRGIVLGDVVLASFDDGLPVLHRVRAVRDGRVWLKGDNRIFSDPPIELDRVVGVADFVEIEGESIPIDQRPRRSLRLTLGRWRHFLARRLRHA